jgi:hypothetical protein
MFNKLIYWITYPYHAYKTRQQIKKRLKELRERDPFIYK